AIDVAVKNQAPVMKWTGKGSLVRLEVIRLYNDETPLQATGILGEGAFVVGYGNTPEEALVEYRSQDRLRPDIPNGWKVDQVMSTYTWAQYGADGKLLVTGVPRGTMVDLEQKVTANWPTYYLQYFKAKADNYALWRRVAITAKSRIEDRVAKAAIDESLKQVEASRKRVADLQTKLEDALEKERRGAEGVIILRALQGILSVAQLASNAAK